MENLINRYLFSQWKHNEGYQQNWLRRITRQTKTQIIADVQHTLALSDKYKKEYDAGSDYKYVIFQHCAQRFRMVNGKIIPQFTHLSNPDGKHIVTLIEDFNILKCSLPFEDLFNIDVRTFLPEDSKMLKHMNLTAEYFKKEKIKFNEDRIYQFNVQEEKPEDDVDGEIVKHLQSLFGNLPVYSVISWNNKTDTIHERTRYSDTAIHYHMNHFGGDKPVLTFKEHYENRTVSFWLFDDRIVFQREDGIDSW